MKATKCGAAGARRFSRSHTPGPHPLTSRLPAGLALVSPVGPGRRALSPGVSGLGSTRATGDAAYQPNYHDDDEFRLVETKRPRPGPAVLRAQRGHRV
eukprot:3166047-Prymnesium_polylepis.1